jgi:transposase InsO family protein
VGQITGEWLAAETKMEMLDLIDESANEGVSCRRSCELLMIHRSRIVRWQQARGSDKSLENGTPGPEQALHRLLPEERQTMVALARREDLADLSHRELTVTAWEKGLVYVSFSTTYRVLKDAGLMGLRGKDRRHNGASMAPIRKDLTGPNQRWCWDISYLMTPVKGHYLYLFMVLDEYSRKIVHWRISWWLNASEAKVLLEGATANENVLNLPEDQRPEIINDRGRQMKARPVRQVFEDHKMPQLFARPRTPNDNPFIESMFSTVKTDPEFPEQFRDDVQAEAYFGVYVPWYNNEHYHSGIDYVTPHQAHTGQRAAIVEERQRKMQAQRLRRKEVNQNNVGLTQPREKIINNPGQEALCSVIP